MGSVVRALGGLIAALACLALIPSSVDAAGSPRQSLTAILAAGHAQRSVHYVALADNGISRTRLVCDVATTSGIQRITYEQGGRTGKVTVLVSAGTAYVRGDSFILTPTSASSLRPRPNSPASGFASPIPTARTARCRRSDPAVDDRRVPPRRSAVVPAREDGCRSEDVRDQGHDRQARRPGLFVRTRSWIAVAGRRGRDVRQGARRDTAQPLEQPVHLQVPARSVPIGTTGLEVTTRRGGRRPSTRLRIGTSPGGSARRIDGGHGHEEAADIAREVGTNADREEHGGTRSAHTSTAAWRTATASRRAPARRRSSRPPACARCSVASAAGPAAAGRSSRSTIRAR